MVYVKLPPVDELDALLGTERWRVRKDESTDPFEGLDRKLAGKDKVGVKGRKPFEKSHLPNGMGEQAKARSILAGGESGGGLDW